VTGWPFFFSSSPSRVGKNSMKKGLSTREI
jgi:hypothetical protein